MKKIKQISTLCTCVAFAACAETVCATEYASTIDANASSVILQAGDTISVDTNYAIRARNGGSVDVADPKNGGISVTLGTEEAPIASDAIRGIYIQSGASANLGTGTKVTVYADNMDNAATGIVTQGINSSASTVTVGDNFSLTILGNYNRTIGQTIGIRTTSGSTVSIGENAKIEVLEGTGVSVEGSSVITIGDNALITAREGIRASIEGQLKMSNATINAVGSNAVGAFLLAAGNISLTDSAITSENVGIVLQSASSTEGTPLGVITVDGGSVAAKGALVAPDAHTGNVERVHATNLQVVFTNGARAASESGILYKTDPDSTDAGSAISIVIEGAATVVDGAFITPNSLVGTSLVVQDSATWSSTGASNMDSLVLNDANIEFNMTSTTDRITTDTLTLEGDSSVLVGLTNDFLEEIAALGLPQDFDVSIVAASTGGAGDIAYTLATSNAEGSTWTIEDLGGGWFRIDNINVIPEPAQIAALLGLAALFFAYRRRK